MKIYDSTRAIQLAQDLIAATHEDNNDTRKALKSITRGMISSLFEAADRAVFQEECNLTINRAIDMVNREVLIALCGAALKSHDHGAPDPLKVEANLFATAMRDDSACQPAQRGSGVSRGWHTVAMTRQEAINQATNILNSYGITARANTQTNTAEKHNMNVNTLADILLASLDVIADTTGTTVEAMHSKGLTETFDNLLECHAAIGGVHDDVVNAGAKAAAELTLEHDYDGRATYDTLKPSHQEIVSNMMAAYKSNYGLEPSKNTTPSAEPVPVNPAFEQAVNALLGQATSNSITDINAYIAQHVEAQNKLIGLEAEVLRLQSAQSTVRQPMATSGTVQVDASTLSYNVVMRKANEIFLAPDGSKPRNLDFEIVTLEWTDANGDVVQHPDCPAVDEAYQFRLRHLIKFLTAKHFGQNVWLHGHTGTGKTTLAEQIAARIGFPIERLNLDSNLERADIVGGTEIVVQDGVPTTHFKEGILPRAMQQPCMFILDEIDAGRPDVLFVIQRALEGKGLTLTEDGGRTVQPHELFFFCATANSRGQGDEHGWYQGVRPMNLAMLNRFGAFIEVPYLDQDDEERLLAKQYPALSDTEVRKMAQFSTEVRQAFMSGELSQTMSPRNLHAMAMYFLHFRSLMSDSDAMREAVQTTVTDAAPADSTHRIEEIASRVFN